MFGTKHSNSIAKIPWSTKQINRVQNIRIKTIKWKYKQIRGVLAVFASDTLALNK